MDLIKRSLGLIIKYFGFFLSVVSIASIYFSVRIQEAIILLLGLFLLPTGLFLYKLGKRISLPSVYEILKNDPRNPVLYLRSFEDDNDKYINNKIGFYYWARDKPFFDKTKDGGGGNENGNE